jgi:GntR family transcriptional repressor for pyruvate dehydrogenase complex
MTMNSPFAAVAREPRLPDKVAGELQRSILSGALKPGDRLPTERELGDQFGVSRTVIREAVRSLVAKGLLEVRAGSGVRVATIDASAVRETMGTYLRLHGEVDYGNLHEVRSVLEIEVAGRAAERAEEADVDLLRHSCDEMEVALADPERVSVLDVEFHRLLAQATHNGLFVVLLDSIGDILLDIRRATMGIPDRPVRGLEFHRKILDRIAAHDRKGARKAMKAHLEDSEAAWRGLSVQETEDALRG